MATSKTSEAKARVGLDSASFEKGAKAVMAAANSMSATVTAALATAGTAILAVLGAKTVSALYNTVKGVFELGEHMANAGKRAGIAAGQFYLFNNAVEKGLSLKTVAGLIGENAEILNRSASIFRDVAIKLWAVGEKIRGFWLGLMDRVAPVLSRILDGALATSLVSAGQWFGDAIADAVEVVYQLAKDGKLWDTIRLGFEIAFDYAGDRLLWLAKIGYDVISGMFSDAFLAGVTKGLSDAWKEVSSFCESFSQMLASKLIGAFINVFGFVNKMLDRLDAAIKFLNGGDKGDTGKLAEERKQSRDNLLNVFRIANSVSGNAAYKAPEGDGKSFAEKLGNIFAGGKFTPSEDLEKQIETFRETLTGALSGYKRDEKINPSTKFENNTRQAAFGADSLTSIGGGGGVYLGLSVLDVNKMQLSELRLIRAQLSNMGGNQSLTVNNLRTSQLEISRAQTSPSVN